MEATQLRNDNLIPTSASASASSEPQKHEIQAKPEESKMPITKRTPPGENIAFSRKIVERAIPDAQPVANVDNNEEGA